MKEIKLTQNKIALIDCRNYERVNQNKWYANKKGTNWYAMRKKDGKTIFMHREIMDCPDGMEVDHIDGNGLDNRKSNLRICTRAENSMNRRIRSDNISGFKGVILGKRCKRWQARIWLGGIEIPVGYFDTAEEAARAYDKKARELFGEFARTNFS